MKRIKDLSKWLLAAVMRRCVGTESKERDEHSFGRHPNDFEHRCCFKHQIERIGEGIRNGDGETIRVKMRSGKTAIYKIYSQRYNTVFDNTGQKNWKFVFIKYEE